MKEPLEICAINIENFFKGRPKFMTINLFDSDKMVSNEKRIENILNKCDENGYLMTMKKGHHKKWFEVKQILYRGQWSRFENYDSEGHEGISDSNKYLMSFEEFQKRGRPKKIYIDFYHAVSLDE